MEEEPAMAVPDTEQQQEFIIEQEKSTSDSAVKYVENNPEISSEDEFDLSDISHKEKSREEIIAEAEAAAFAEA
jgi:ribonuclease-3